MRSRMIRTILGRTMLGVIAGLALLSGPASAQNCAGSFPTTLANGTNADATQVMANFTYLLNCINNLPAATSNAVTAQGRLTLVSATPVMTSSQSAKTTIYYTQYNGNQIQIYNGTSMVSTSFVELSNVTTNSSVGNAGPAAVAANSNYDLFAWSNSGTATLTRGPAWTSDTARGAGAGTTELQRVNGMWTNKNAITNGPAANLGTYVGTVRSNGSSQIDYTFGGNATGGTPGFFGVWNAYNRVPASATVGETTASWVYSTSTWRASNNSSGNRSYFVIGLNEDAVEARLYSHASLGSGPVVPAIGIGLNTTTAISGPAIGPGNTATLSTTSTGYSGFVGIGFHYLSANEYGSGGSSTFYGAPGGPAQNGLIVTVRN